MERKEEYILVTIWFRKDDKGCYHLTDFGAIVWNIKNVYPFEYKINGDIDKCIESFNIWTKNYNDATVITCNIDSISKDIIPECNNRKIEVPQVFK